MRTRGIAGLVVVVMLGLAGCGDDTTDAAEDDPGTTEPTIIEPTITEPSPPLEPTITEPSPPLGPAATGEPGRPTPADGAPPLPCAITGVEDLPGAPGPLPDAPALLSTPEQRDEAVAIVLDHPGWEGALAVGRARLAWATPWFVEDEVERGVLLMYELDEPADLPTDVGISAEVGEGDTSRPVYDDEGLPVVEPVPDGAWDDARSARLAVDLVAGRLHEVTAGPEPTYC